MVAGRKRYESHGERKAERGRREKWWEESYLEKKGQREIASEEEKRKREIGGRGVRERVGGLRGEEKRYGERREMREDRVERRER